MFEEILKAVKAHSTVIIHRHTSPDGDAMGSQLGLKALLKENFPDKEVYAVGDETKRFAFMEGATMDDIADGKYEGALAIILDCGAPHLVSDERYRLAKTTARIDHHIFSGKFADIEVIATSYESCCGEITEFALESGLALSSTSAKALYTGMVTDSGRFRYDSTTSDTFRLASALLKEKFDLNGLYAELYADDFAYVRLKAQFVLKINFSAGGVAYIYTKKEELPAYGVDTFTVSRGMVATMADLKGVDVWVNFTETEESVLVEIRSNKYNINPVAVKYGGGGHAKASGASVKDYETAMALLADLDEIRRENHA